MTWIEATVAWMIAFPLGCAGQAEAESTSTETGESTSDGDPGDGDGDSGDGDGDSGDGDSGVGDSGDGDGDPCANGVLDDGEACDDGNLDNGDGCNDACQISGSLLWSDAVPSGQYGVYPMDVALDGAGNLVVGATQYPDGGPLNSDVFVGAWTPSGAQAWTFTDDGDDHDDRVVGLTVDGQGRAVLAAKMGDQIGSVGRVTTFALDGQPAWSQTIKGPNDGSARPDVIMTDAQGRVSVGGSLIVGGSDEILWWVQTHTLDGSLAWTDTWDHAVQDHAQALVALDDGSLAAMGQVGSDSFDVALRVHDDVDALLWSDIYDSNRNDEVSFLAQSHGRIVAVVAIALGTDSDADVIVRTFDLDGNLLSEHEPSGPGEDQANAARMLDSGEFVLAWTDKPSDEFEEPADAVVSVFAPDGSVVWTDVFDNAGRDDSAHSMIVDGLGRIVVAGTASTDETQDLWLRCLELDGSVAWQTDWDTVDDVHEPLLTLDASGHVVVAGHTQQNAIERAMWARAYDEQGAVVWTWEYDNPGIDRPNLLTTNANGDAAIVGMVTIDGARQLYVAVLAH